MSRTSIACVLDLVEDEIGRQGCPLRGCTYIVEVPAIPELSDALGDIFGMSGQGLTRMYTDAEATAAAETMRTHLQTHTPEDWLQLVETTVMLLEVRG